MDLVENPASSETSRHTVYIVTFDENHNEIAKASGFLISPNVVVTAGHVVFDSRDGGYGEDGWIASAKVIPAAYPATGSEPYGTAEGRQFFCGWDWANYLDYDDDWGVIILNANIGSNAGWFGLRYQSASYNGTSVRANGYERFFPYTVSGTITSSKSKTLVSNNIYITKGMSGGPCYIHSDEYGFQAIAIISLYHSYDEEGVYHSDSVFRRIDKTLFNTLLGYCDDYAI